MNTKPLSILLIDDNPNDRADIRQNLLCGSEQRYYFTEAEMGEEGLRKILEKQDEPYDCVLLDYHLPDMNADEILAKLCKDSEIPCCPVLVITGSNNKDGSRLIQAGAQDYIGKNWGSPQSLTRAVSNAIERYAMLVDNIQAKELLRIERERLSIALRCGQMGVYDWNLSKGNYWWSDEAYPLYGLNPDNLVLSHNSFTALIHPDDHDGFWHHFNKSITQRTLFLHEFRILYPDGTLRWLAHRGQAEYDVNDHAWRHFGIVADITECRINEERRHFTEQLHSLSFELAPAGIVYVNPDGAVINANEKMSQITGYSNEELVGMKVTNLTYPEDLIHDIELLKPFLKGAAPLYKNEKRYVRKDGSICWVTAKACMVTDKAGKAVHSIGVIQDITEHKRAELELMEAKSVAEKANLAKSEFLSRMSHELRTPLNAILGFAQLMEASDPPPTASQKIRLEQVLKAGWYLLELINEVLDLALVESGKLSLSQEPVSLNDVLVECHNMIAPLAQEHSIQLNFTCFDNLGVVYADRTRLKQILINLLSNAIKYNRPQGKVDVKCTLSNAGRIRISIKDTGQGLSPKNLAHLFEPFNRLGQENSTKEGTGIGLVVTKTLVELMEGAIGVESTVGMGSEFWVELNQDVVPCFTDDDIMAAQLAPPAEELPQRTLLYVEDNAANLLLVEHIIADYPRIKMLSARNSTVGIEIARSQLPDVILMDINMPGMNGIKTLNILRQDPVTAHIPVIALSAHAMAHDIEKGLESGFFRYLTKPLNINDFITTLNHALEFSEMGLIEHNESGYLQ